MIAKPLLVIGSKNYSSWSLRPWLHLRKVGFEFEERVIAFDAPDYRAQIAAASPSRRVPVLRADPLVVWDSLAICEYASDLTGRGRPRETSTRALARAAAAEMHAGFAVLREQCPMNVRAHDRRVPQSEALRADIGRIDALWTECRARHADDGPWLFGEFSIADAMFAPVAFRFRTYGATLSTAARAYLDGVLADPDVAAWSAAAHAEGHTLPDVDRVGA